MDSKKLEEITARLREMRLPVMANQIVTMYEASELNDVIKVLDIITQEELMSRKNNTADRYRKSAHLSQGYTFMSRMALNIKRNGSDITTTGIILMSLMIYTVIRSSISWLLMQIITRSTESAMTSMKKAFV